MLVSAPADAIASCRDVLVRSGSTFSHAFRLLPGAQRDAMTAFYAYCREVDDAVDSSPDAQSAGQAIDAWERRIAGIYGRTFDGPVPKAMVWAVDRFGIRREHLELILDGVRQDLAVSRYETFRGLYEYCYRVASAVGLVCVSILGEESSQTALYAELTGIAVQLTNILRDIGEDADRGRIYLPLEDLRSFNVSETDVLRRTMTPDMKLLLRYEARRAQVFYEMAQAVLPPETMRRLFFAETLRETYRYLLDGIVRQDFPVFDRRVSVGPGRKLAIALRHRLDPRTMMVR
jgi:phytoene synthase